MVKNQGKVLLKNIEIIAPSVKRLLVDIET
jgi:hypothetical protein